MLSLRNSISFCEDSHWTVKTDVLLGVYTGHETCWMTSMSVFLIMSLIRPTTFSERGVETRAVLANDGLVQFPLSSAEKLCVWAFVSDMRLMKTTCRHMQM